MVRQSGPVSEGAAGRVAHQRFAAGVDLVRGQNRVVRQDRLLNESLTACLAWRRFGEHRHAGDEARRDDDVRAPRVGAKDRPADALAQAEGESAQE